MEDNLIFTVQLTPDEVDYLLKITGEEGLEHIDNNDANDAIVTLLKNLKNAEVN